MLEVDECLGATSAGSDSAEFYPGCSKKRWLFHKAEAALGRLFAR